VVSDLPAACLPEVLLASPALSRLRPQVAAVSCPVFPVLAPAPEAARSASLARLSDAVVQPAQPVLSLAGSGASAQPAAALRPEEPAAWDAAVLPEAAVAVWVAAAVPRQAEAARVAAAEQQQAAQDAALVQQPEVQDAVVVQQPAAPDAAVLQPAAPGVPAELPSAAAWVFHRDQVLPWPVPQPAARFVRVMACLQIAAPSERWWQAATSEVLS
jgi:hypothetical protein